MATFVIVLIIGVNFFAMATRTVASWNASMSTQGICNDVVNIFFSDRTGGGKFCEEYELATSKIDEFSGMLRREQQERQDMIKVLEDGEAFCDTSYGEVKVIVHVSVITVRCSV